MEVEQFEKIIELAKKEGVDLNNKQNELSAYLSIKSEIKYGETDREFSKEEIDYLISLVVDVYIESDKLSIGAITEFCVQNYEDLKYMTNTEIIEEIII